MQNISKTIATKLAGILVSFYFCIHLVAMSNTLFLGCDMGFFGSELAQPLGQMGGEISKWLFMI